MSVNSAWPTQGSSSSNAKTFLDQIEAVEEFKELEALIGAGARLSDELAPYFSLWYHDDSAAGFECVEDAPLLLVAEVGASVTSVAPEHNRVRLGEGLVGAAMLRAIEQVNAGGSEPGTIELDTTWNLSDPSVRASALASEFVEAERLTAALAVAWVSPGTPNGVALLCSRRVGRDFGLEDRELVSFVGRQSLNHLRRLSRRRQLALMHELAGGAENRGTETADSTVLESVRQHLKAESTYLILEGALGDAQQVRFRSHDGHAGQIDSSLFEVLERSSSTRLYNAWSSIDELDAYSRHVGVEPHHAQEALSSLAHTLPPVEPFDHLLAAPVPFSTPLRDRAFIVVRRTPFQPGFMPEDERLLCDSAKIIGDHLSRDAELRQARGLLRIANTGGIETRGDAAARVLDALAALPHVGEVLLFRRDGVTGEWVLTDGTPVPSATTKDVAESVSYGWLLQNDQLLRSKEFVLSPLLSENENSVGSGLADFTNSYAFAFSTTERDPQAAAVYFLETPPSDIARSIEEVGRQAQMSFETFALRESLQRYRDNVEHFARDSTAAMITVSLGHEIKNALHGLDASVAPLPGYAAELRSDKILSKRSRARIASVLTDTAADIESEVDRMDELARLLRDIVAGDGPASGKPSFLSDVVQVFEAILSDKAALIERIKLVVDLDPLLSSSHKAPWAVSCDPSAIGLALINFVDNAIAASHTGGRVEVSTKLVLSRATAGSKQSDGRSGHAELLVRDFGSGVESSLVPHLFKPFATTKKDGHGLGLSITRNVIEREGGALIVNPHVAPGFEIGLRFAAVSPRHK